MRRTPPVVVQLQPQPVVQALAALTAMLASAGLGGWAASHQLMTWPAWLIVPLATVLGWRAAAVRPRRLRWDGEAWWLAASGTEETRTRLTVLVDLGGWLLLHASSGPCWLPLSQRQQAAHWGALRATLFAAPGGGGRS